MGRFSKPNNPPQKRGPHSQGAGAGSGTGRGRARARAGKGFFFAKRGANFDTVFWPHFWGRKTAPKMGTGIDRTTSGPHFWGRNLAPFLGPFFRKFGPYFRKFGARAGVPWAPGLSRNFACFTSHRPPAPEAGTAVGLQSRPAPVWAEVQRLPGERQRPAGPGVARPRPGLSGRIPGRCPPEPAERSISLLLPC